MIGLGTSSGLMVVALASGIVLGSAASVAIAGESVYGGGPWSQFSGSLALSPILMTLGIVVSLGAKGAGFFAVLCSGAVCAIASPFVGIRRRFPRPQWLMFLGTFLWSLGNATAMEAMMAV
jgi:4-hydroxybenzoate polyprenyltransferase